MMQAGCQYGLEEHRLLLIHIGLGLGLWVRVRVRVILYVRPSPFDKVVLNRILGILHGLNVRPGGDSP